MRIDPCGHCGTIPKTARWNGRFEIWCPAPDHICYPGAWVVGTDEGKTIIEWNTRHGKNKDKND